MCKHAVQLQQQIGIFNFRLTMSRNIQQTSNALWLGCCGGGAGENLHAVAVIV